MNVFVVLWVLLVGWGMAQQRSGYWTVDTDIDPISNERSVFIYAVSKEASRAELVVLCKKGKVDAIAIMLHRYLGSKQRTKALWRFGLDTEPTEAQLWLSTSGDFAYFFDYEQVMLQKLIANTTFAIRIYGPLDTVTYTFNVGGFEEALRLSDCSS